ncbi:MAG: NADH:flavin oxidoreductase [Chloroflexi bacterium]|nr:NADH:flavin oxidoreductase [Chloroflexota bacterium]
MPGLFDTIDINGVKLKNRLVMPPMATKMATEEGGVTDRHLRHYMARARGGVGLIIVEHTYVLKNGQMSAGQLGLYEDRLIDGVRRLVEAIHREGAKAAMQLTHAGAKAAREFTGEQPAGPSEVAPPKGKDLPRALRVGEMQQIVKAFGEAARRAMDAGFDAVELHGAHGFLLCQFLSPLTNRRSDKFGGDLDGRLRFPTEVIKEVKRQLGEGSPLFYRFGADDMVDGGMTREEGRQAAQRLEHAGVDVIDISGGLGGSGHERFTEQGYYVSLAQGVKEVVKVPVIGVGNITEPEYADRIVREGRVDLVAFGHKLLSDPDFPKEAARKLGVEMG